MWSPTSPKMVFSPSARVRRAAGEAHACPCTHRSRPAALLLLVLLSVLILDGCGYRPGSATPSVVGDGTKTLKIKGVDYPTLEAWLPYAIRSRLRDEVNARYLAKWVDSGSADYEIQINVISYTTRQWMRTELDTTLLYDSTMIIEAIVYDGSTNKEVWRSGKLSYADRLESSDQKGVAEDIITQLIRILADKMRNTF